METKTNNNMGIVQRMKATKTKKDADAILNEAKTYPTISPKTLRKLVRVYDTKV